MALVRVGQEAHTVVQQVHISRESEGVSGVSLLFLPGDIISSILSMRRMFLRKESEEVDISAILFSICCCLVTVAAAVTVRRQARIETSSITQSLL